jgi:hypothetical protein
MQFADERTKRKREEMPIDNEASGEEINMPMKSQNNRIHVVTFVLGFALAALSLPVSAQGTHSKKNTFVAKDSVQTASAAPASTSETYYSSHSDIHYGLGFASAYNLTASDTALTGWIGLSPKFGIQPLVSIGSTSPFNFSIGALGKYTVAQHGAGGFHLGGGLSVGSIHKGTTGGGILFGNSGSMKSGFNMGLSALAGLHYEIQNTNIMLHFDGGANFGLADGDTDFNLATVGGLLGASIIYMF